MQYSPAAAVPLIKSPSLRLPLPVSKQPDIHPLPDDISPYFVYPFTLEPHVITLESSRRSTLAAHAARREAYLNAREDDRERRRRDALRRVAPGFEPNAGLLVPTRSSVHVPDEPEESKDVMDVLVEQLARLESTS